MEYPVNITILGDDIGTTPVSGVSVRVYTTLGATVTSGVTNGSGLVSFTLPNATYDLRFYKVGLSILPKQPQQIVVSTSLPNNFKVTGHITTLAESLDGTKCRITGSIINPMGTKENFPLSISSQYESLILNNSINPSNTIATIRPDTSGNFDFELPRGLKYFGYLPNVSILFGSKPGELDLRVPNRPALSLEKFLFPVHASLTFSSTTLALPLSSDWNNSITAPIVFSDFSERTTSVPWSTLDYSSSVPNIVEFVVEAGFLYVKPIAVGATTLTVTRSISNKLYYPGVPSFTSNSITITVS